MAQQDFKKEVIVMLQEYVVPVSRAFGQFSVLY